jgi:hypothetical protein
MTTRQNSKDMVHGEKNQEDSQTIFLATRMDLISRIIPKREKPKQQFMVTDRPSTLSGLEQKPTIH